MLANNETGIIQPINKISNIAKDNDMLFHTDAVQAIGRVFIDFNKIGCDFLTMSSHKIGGLKGSGALVVKNKNKLRSSLIGGSQEYSLRPGTEALTAIAGFGMAATKINLDDMKNIEKVRNFFEKELVHENKDILLVGNKSKRLPNTFLCFVFQVSHLIIFLLLWILRVLK